MPAPQSKPVTQASRLVARNAPSVAFGLGVRIPPQGQLTYDCTPIHTVCERGSQKLLKPPARIGRLPPAAARPTAHGPRGTMEPRDETTAKRMRISVHSNAGTTRLAAARTPRSAPASANATLSSATPVPDRAGAAECDRASRAGSGMASALRRLSKWAIARKRASTHIRTEDSLLGASRDSATIPSQRVGPWVGWLVRSASPQALLAFRAIIFGQKGREAVGHGHRTKERPERGALAG